MNTREMMERYKGILQIGISVISLVFLSLVPGDIENRDMANAALDLGISLNLLSVAVQPSILFMKIRPQAILTDLKQPTLVPIWVWVVSNISNVLIAVGILAKIYSAVF
jgi:hypothetical protein